jgi:serine/threonine-protein kinase RsbW
MNRLDGAGSVADGPAPHLSGEAVSPHYDVSLRIPADSAYLSILRTATAGLAARLDFTLDDIEDLRIAVDEACALLLPQATLGSDLSCGFVVQPDCLTVEVTASSPEPREPSRDGFAWTVLTALASQVDARTDHDAVTLSLVRRRESTAS